MGSEVLAPAMDMWSARGELMKSYSLTHLADRILLHDLAALVARDRSTTATLLAHIGEVDARKLYLPAARPSMYAYCVQELRLSEDSAYKRIQAARVVRQYPVAFEMLADGRLHLSAVCLLATHMNPGNASDLLLAAANKTKSEIEQLIAKRFPSTELLELTQVISAASIDRGQLAPGQVHALHEVHARASANQLAPGPVEASTPRARLQPVASQRFALQVMVGQGTHDKLRYAKSLLRHQIPSGDMAAVLDRALDALIVKLEKSKFAATDRPRARRQPMSPDSRHIPAHVKRAVWARDGVQCTFVSETGHRCQARALLEFDHIEEVARGGSASTDRMRLLCRAHNQYAAECKFGAEFMNHKRQEARCAAAKKREAMVRAASNSCSAAEKRATEARAAAQTAVERAGERDVIPWLRHLGFRADEARRAAARCEAIPDASLEERVRLALSFLSP
jgi:RuvA, C-terminal domain